MPRTAVSATALTPNASIVEPTGTTIDATLVTNGVEVTAGNRTELVVLEVANTAGAPKNVIVRAGDNPPAASAGQGDLTVAVTNATTRRIGPFESARFIQSDGKLNVDFESGTTGTIKVVALPATL